MDALQERMQRRGRAADLHLERFGAAAPVAEPASTGAFELELARTGVVLAVSPEQSVLEAVRAAGVEHPSSCEMGICGTCEAPVLAGEIDHRDDLYTDDERAAGTHMLICVSRARGCQRLVLDL
jgi:ferredoxin